MYSTVKIYIYFFVFLFLFPPITIAVEDEPIDDIDAVAATGSRETADKEKERKKKSSKDFEPAVSLGLAPSLPMGYMRETFSFGYGGRLAASIRLPWNFMPLNNWINWRSGASAGYYTYSASGDDFEANISFIPTTADLRAVFVIPPLQKYKLLPYMGAGLGASFASSSRTQTDSEETTASSTDFTVLFGSGLSWNIPGLNFLAVFFDAQYMLAAEVESAHILNLSPGVAYFF